MRSNFNDRPQPRAQKAAARKCEKAAARKSPLDRLVEFLEAAGPDIRDGETHSRVETHGPGRRIRSPGVLVCPPGRPASELGIEIQRLKQVARDVRTQVVINDRIVSFRLRTRDHMSDRRCDLDDAIYHAWWVCTVPIS